MRILLLVLVLLAGCSGITKKTKSMEHKYPQDFSEFTEDGKSYLVCFDLEVESKGACTGWFLSGRKDIARFNVGKGPFEAVSLCGPLEGKTKEITLRSFGCDEIVTKRTYLVEINPPNHSDLK